MGDLKPHPNPEILRMQMVADHVASTTRAYAEFSGGAGGIASVFAGLLLFVTSALSNTIMKHLTMRMLFSLAPFVWLFGKIWLQRTYYQQFGWVTKAESSSFQSLDVLIPLVFALHYMGDSYETLTVQTMAFWPRTFWILCFGLLVYGVVSCVSGFKEAVVCGALLSQAASFSVGVLHDFLFPFHDLWGANIFVIVLAVNLVLEGWTQHRRFLGVRKNLTNLAKVAA